MEKVKEERSIKVAAREHPSTSQPSDSRRVNLIGEHVDYEGYSVLPMALLHDTIVAIRKVEAGEKPSKLHIGNVQTSKYGDCCFSADPSQEVNRANHAWANYFLCGYKGVFEHLHAKGLDIGALVGLDVLVEGNVPVGELNFVH